jgi:hypothetical protein
VPLWASLQDDINQGVQETIPNVKTSTKNINYVSIAQEMKFWLFAFVGIIAVAYIIYIGAKLLWAPGNTEEITTSLKSLGYVVVGLALIPFAYFIVQFIVNMRI